jgi:hypothetical protein
VIDIAIIGGIDVMDRDQAIKLLQGKVAAIGEWNQQRGADEAIPDLKKGVNLACACLAGSNLSGVNLSNSERVNSFRSSATSHKLSRVSASIGVDVL